MSNESGSTTLANLNTHQINPDEVIASREKKEEEPTNDIELTTE